MTAVLGSPLVVSGAIAALCALSSLAHPFLGLAIGTAVSSAGCVLAVVSADPPRRVVWSAAAVVAAAITVRQLVPLPALGAVGDGGLAALRSVLAEPLRTLVPEPESALLMGIVLGERAGIGRELRDAFAATGTAHLLAISGSNMTLVAAGVRVALHGHARPALLAALTVLALAGYTVLIGPQPSVVRAALMAAVGSLGLALGRPSAAANALGAAVAAMLIVDPLALEDVGFVLSVAATGGLIAWEPSLAARFAGVPRPIAAGLAATVAASVPTIPVVAAVFGRVSLVSPLANLVAVPLFAPVMVFGAATAVVGAVAAPAAWPLALAGYASAAALRHAVETAAAVPLASIDVAPGMPTGVAVGVALLGAWLTLRRVASAARGALRRARRPHISIAIPFGSTMPAAGIAAAGVVVLAASAVLAAALPRAGGSHLHALDIGQGDAFLIESDGRYALIDGGPDGTLLLRRLGEILPPWQRRVDLIVLTHEHADHGSGLLAVLDRYEVGLAIEPAGMADVPLTRMWWERLARTATPHRAVAAGATVRVGRATLRVLAPGDRRTDVPSLVVHATLGTSSVLFMGDATDDAIADLLLDPEALASRVYVPPHHGADTPHSRALVAAVRPTAAVISAGAMNRYGHPTPATLAALGAIPVYRTDRYGTVVLTFDADPIRVRTAKAGLPADRGGPVPRASSSR